MSKFNQLFVATVQLFMGSTEEPAQPDKNGNMPVILDVVAGKCPDQRVLSGTVANNAGFEVGKAYLCKVTDQGERTYINERTGKEETGRQLIYNPVTVVGFTEIMQAHKELGQGTLLEVNGPVNAGAEAEPKGSKSKTPLEN